MKLSMKVFSVNGKPDVPAVPQELFRQIQSIQQLLAVPMRSFGFSTVRLNVLPTTPVPDVHVMTQDMDKTLIPQAILDKRRSVLRGLREFMLVFGLQEVTIELSDAEWAELQAYWKYLASGSTDALDKEHFKNVPLRFDVDPTNEPVAKPDEQTKQQQ